MRYTTPIDKQLLPTGNGADNVPQPTLRLTNTQLVDALNGLGVHFLAGGSGATVPLDPATLLVRLAQNSEARLRLALIPLLLVHPEHALFVRPAVQQLPVGPKLTLQCYYTAAHLLQRQHSDELLNLLDKQTLLPDLFSVELKIIEAADVESKLSHLAQQHRQLSGRAINWLGTYQHAARRLISRLQHERAWTRSVV